MTVKPPAVGDLAPDFELPDENGQKHKLSDFRGRRVVLYFYPADDTGGCTKQACAFRDAYPAIEEKNGIVIGISPDDAASHVRISGTLLVQPAPVGGDARETEMTEVTLQVIDYTFVEV